jgi:hypothetical protein
VPRSWQATGRVRPRQERARDEEVEDGLREQARRERRDVRPLHALAHGRDLDDVAAAGRGERVDPDAGQVGAEHRPERDPLARERGPDDRVPRAAAQQQVHRVERERDQQQVPLHVGDVIEERSQRVEEGADRFHQASRSPGGEVTGCAAVAR